MLSSSFHPLPLAIICPPLAGQPVASSSAGAKEKAKAKGKAKPKKALADGSDDNAEGSEPEPELSTAEKKKKEAAKKARQAVCKAATSVNNAKRNHDEAVADARKLLTRVESEKGWRIFNDKKFTGPIHSAIEKLDQGTNDTTFAKEVFMGNVATLKKEKDFVKDGKAFCEALNPLIQTLKKKCKALMDMRASAPSDDDAPEGE
eukprot:7484290-Pyramimonas_sp.AAC.1